MTRFQPSPRPETTPWDAPDRADQVLPGIWRVSTPSHGGYVLSDERQAAMPEALRRDDPYYEEDVDYALVLYAFGSEFRRLPIPGIALQVENARRSVRCWHPDRWTALTGESPEVEHRAKYEIDVDPPGVDVSVTSAVVVPAPISVVVGAPPSLATMTVYPLSTSTAGQPV